jgi:hypothetical protein
MSWAAPSASRPRRVSSGNVVEDAAVTMAYFNPTNSWLLARNLLIARAAMEARGIHPYVVEVLLPSQSPLLANAARTLTLRARDVLWHKERALNLLIERLPERYDKVVWVDGDVIFPDPDWLGRACQRLQRHTLVQLFDHAVLLDRAGQQAARCGGVADRVRRRIPQALRLGLRESHPGFGWAAQRSFLAEHGLFDQSVVGGGDSLLVLAAYGAWDHWHARALPRDLREAWLRWAMPVHTAVKGDVGAVPTTVFHLWHGDEAARQYVTRLELLRHSTFDPVADLAASADGLWEWASPKDALHSGVIAFFRRRDPMLG